MDPPSDHDFSQRQSSHDPLQGSNDAPLHHEPAESTPHSYFEASISQSSHAISTIPEGSAVRAAQPVTEKSPSPPTSSTATTSGSTETPTSLEANTTTSSCEVGGGKGPGSEFARESLSSHHHNVNSFAPQDDTRWRPTPSQPLSMYSAPPPGMAYSTAAMFTPPMGALPGQQHRQQQQQQQQGQATQPPQRYNPAMYPCALKLMVSNNVAGAIIGRGGQSISELQTQTMTRIKLSQTGDFYPGTQDRVCLVQGEVENVKSAVRLLLERIHILQAQFHLQQTSWEREQAGANASDFDFVVRILVPSTSCGMIIGKAGSNIKFMEETTGVASVRLSPKESPDAAYPGASIVSATSERIVTVTGPSLDGCVQCVYLIIDGMESNPDAARYTNMTTSYSRIMSEAYIAAGHTQPMLVSMPSPQHSSPDQHLWDAGLTGVSSPYAQPPRRIVSSPNLMLQHGPPVAFQPHQHSPEQLTGYTTGINVRGPMFPMEQSISGAPTADGPRLVDPNVLAQQPQDRSRDTLPANTGPHIRTDINQQLAGVHHSVSAPNLLAMQMESMHLSAPSAQFAANPETFVPQAPTLTDPGCFTAQVLVPDSRVGSILGLSGRSLTELQMLSGTVIRISQRGEYMPGTRSRVVFVRGPTAHSVWQAQYMMSQRMVLPPTAAHPAQLETATSPSGSGITQESPSRSSSSSAGQKARTPTTPASSSQTQGTISESSSNTTPDGGP